MWDDGGGAQHTINVVINGKPYIIHADEAGSGGNSSAGWEAACNMNLPAWQFARIIDVSDETKPTIVSKLMLEAYDPKNCAKVLPDLAGLGASRTARTIAASTTGRTPPRWPAGISTRASACSTFAIRPGQRKSPTTIRPARRQRVPVRTTSERADGLPAVPTGARLRSSSMPRRNAADDVPGQRFLVLKFTNGVWPFPGARHRRVCRTDRRSCDGYRDARSWCSCHEVRQLELPPHRRKAGCSQGRGLAGRMRPARQRVGGEQHRNPGARLPVEHRSESAKRTPVGRACASRQGARFPGANGGRGSADQRHHVGAGARSRGSARRRAWQLHDPACERRPLSGDEPGVVCGSRRRRPCRFRHRCQERRSAWYKRGQRWCL